MPLIYLDVVVDSLLKGLDEQFNSMKYNFADSFLRVTLVLLLLNRLGMESYVGILFFSTIFNAALSLRRLMKVSALRLSPRHIALPLLWAGVCVLAGRWVLGLLPLEFPFARVAFQCLLCGGLFAAGYWLLSQWEKKQPGPL